ncbi:MTCP1 [Penicillium camemberti]|uniref:Cx9C motif-containing protein 4, mitochondrial n=1 Tax=Penicillium camemberti (strain FM 013) TaxID=1429867 RepID=A0A0G4P779_PENC3|nr:MTCP1 [Penicillium camemberti]
MGNLKQDLSHEQPCKPRAVCVPPDCLQKNSFNEDKCQAQIDALYECCNAFYQVQGDQASTLSCPKANLLRLKMKQRAQAAEKQ